MQRALFAILLIVIVVAPRVHADTTWVAAGTVSGLWIAPESPYVITGDVDIPTGNSLMIGPGVTVYFAGQYHFYVHGALRALGVEGDSIRFTTDTLANTARWQGLRFIAAHNSTELSYCIIEHGRAILEGADRAGGGLDLQGTTMTLRHSTIRRCRAAADGGAIHVHDQSNPLIEDCVFESCYAGAGGGAMLLRNSSGVVRRNHFDNNFAANYGGAIYPRNDSVVLIEDCRFDHNTAAFDGGAICGSHGGTNVTARRCYFSHNQAGTRGGGVYGREWRARFENCVFESNSADSGGSCYAAVDPGRYLRLLHCTINGSAGEVGGAIWCYRGPIYLWNTIVASTTSGPALQFQSIATDSASVRGCAFWNNALGDVGGVPFSPTFGVLDSANANDDSCDAAGNLFLDPRFVDAAAGDFHLAEDSRCIGAAVGGVLSEDYDSGLRPQPAFTQPDIGAFENARGGDHVFICGPLSGTIGPGDLTVGCDISVRAGDTLVILPDTRLLFPAGRRFDVNGVLLAEGTETDSVTFTRADANAEWFGLHFGSTDGLTESRLAYCVVEHAGSTGSPFPRGGGIGVSGAGSVDVHNCTIQYNRALLNGGGMAVEGSARVRLEACEFRHNQAPATGGQGGALFLSSTNPQWIFECRFDSNFAAADGGGVYLHSVDSELINCHILGNSSRSGAGLHASAEGCVIRGCTIEHNDATAEGGGVAAYFGVHVDSCLIADNTAGTRGGGVAMYDGDIAPRFTHCIITHNVSASGGGASSWWGGTLEQCSVVGNAATAGGGLFVDGNRTIVNSTIVTGSSGSGLYFASTVDSARIEYCDCFDNSGTDFEFQSDRPPLLEGLGELVTVNALGDSCDAFLNIGLDPLFVDVANRDYHLQPVSSCIDAGSELLAPDPDGSLADIGAFYTTSPFSTPDPFNLISPATGDTLREHELFSWQAAFDPDTGEAIWYELEFAAVDTFDQSSLVLATYDAGSAIERVVDVDSLPRRENSRYYWSVLAHSRYPRFTTRSAESRLFHPWSYSTPAPFALVSPDSGASLRGTAEFIWAAAVDPDSGEQIWYEVAMAALDTATQGWTTLGLYFAGDSTHRSVNIDSLPRQSGSVYYWYVLAHSQYPAATTRSAEQRRFEPWVYTAPARFHLLTPADTDTFQLPDQTFCWNASADLDPGDTVRYRLIVTVQDTITQQSTVLRSLDTGLDTCATVSLDSLEHGRWTYMSWHVTARSAHPVAEVASFETNRLIWIVGPPINVPRPFHLISPTDGVTLGGVHEFRWQASVDADTGEQVTFSLRFLSYDSVAQEWDTLSTLDAGELTHLAADVNPLGQRDHTAYYWHVLAHSMYPPVSVRSIEQHRFVLDTTQVVGRVAALMPSAYALHPVYPNPFNATTTISFDLPRVTDLMIKVFDISGRLTTTLHAGTLSAGRHRIAFDGRALPSGTFYVRMSADDFTATRKLLLLK